MRLQGILVRSTTYIVLFGATNKNIFFIFILRNRVAETTVLAPDTFLLRPD